MITSGAGRFVAAIGVAASLSLAVTACGAASPKGPTVAQAGAKLHSNVTKLLEAVRASHVKIVDSGGTNISCGKGKAKRTYRVTAQRPDVGGKPADAIIQVTGAAVGVDPGYKVTRHVAGALKSTLHATDSRTTITVSTPKQGEMTVSGSTDCLRIK